MLYYSEKLIDAVLTTAQIYEKNLLKTGILISFGE